MTRPAPEQEACRCSHGFSCPDCGGCRDHHERGCRMRPLRSVRGLPMSCADGATGSECWVHGDSPEVQALLDVLAWDADTDTDTMGRGQWWAWESPKALRSERTLRWARAWMEPI